MFSLVSHLQRFFGVCVCVWFSKWLMSEKYLTRYWKTGGVTLVYLQFCASGTTTTKKKKKKSDQIYFRSDANKKKTESCHNPQHVVVLRHLLSVVSPPARHISNSRLIYKWGESGNKKKPALALFCAYKAWWRMEWREYTKVIMSPLFSDEKLIWNCPDFFLQRRARHQGCMFAPSPQNVLSQPTNHPCWKKRKRGRTRQKKGVIFLLCLYLSLWVILARRVRPPRRPSPTESSSIVCWTPSWRISQNHKHILVQMYVCSCNSQRSQGVGPMHFFVKKLYLKWNLSRAACGKHCHFRETAKLYKAFPPKGST